MCNEQVEEVWKDIPNFEEYYQASTIGRIRSKDRYTNYKNNGTLALRKGKLLSPKTTNKGYLEVGLTVNGKLYHKRVHQLIALTFIPNPNNFTQINHINENKTDNRVENLEWCTAKQNVEAYHESRTLIYQYSSKGELIKVWNSITKAAKSIGGDKTGIQHCCVGKLSNGALKKTYLGYIWSYKILNETELKHRITNNNVVKVQQFDLSDNLLNIYNSIAEAAKAVKCNPSAISMACSGIRKTIKGYKWKKN